MPRSRRTMDVGTPLIRPMLHLSVHRHVEGALSATAVGTDKSNARIRSSNSSISRTRAAFTA